MPFSLATLLSFQSTFHTVWVWEVLVNDMLNGKTNVVLEWNEGNHFQETDLRMAKGFAWILKK